MKKVATSFCIYACFELLLKKFQNMCIYYSTHPDFHRIHSTYISICTLVVVRPNYFITFKGITSVVSPKSSI